MPPPGGAPWSIPGLCYCAFSRFESPSNPQNADGELLPLACRMSRLTPAGNKLYFAKLYEVKQEGVRYSNVPLGSRTKVSRNTPGYRLLMARGPHAVQFDDQGPMPRCGAVVSGRMVGIWEGHSESHASSRTGRASPSSIQMCTLSLVPPWVQGISPRPRGE